MSIFKIKLVKLIDKNGWKEKYINAGRISKICKVCGKQIYIGDPSTAFSKRDVQNGKDFWTTLYTHTGPCTIKLRNLLGIKQ